MTVSMSRIGDILELQREPMTIDTDSEYRRIGIYSWGKGFLHRPPTPGAEMGSLRYFTFPEGALVLSNIQAWEAAVALSGPTERGYVASNRFLPYVPIDKSRVSINYLLHYFLSEDGIAALRRASPGTQVRNRTLGQKLFEDIKIPLPDTFEQNRIASHLNRIAHGSTRIYSSNREYVIAEHGLADQAISAIEAEHRPLRDIATLTRDAVEIDPYAEYRTLGLLNHGRGVFARDPILGSETKYPRYFQVKAHQLVYSKLFGWEGSVAVIPERYDKYHVSAEFPTFDLDPSLALPAYLDHIVRWNGFTAQLASATTGMGQRRQRVNVSDFEAIKVPLPDLAEQYRVVAHLDKLTSITELIQRRKDVAVALLPAARNEVFSALR